MKKNTIILLRSIVVLLGLCALLFLLIEPHFEGRNINATYFEIYFNDPFLAFAYLGSTPFFIALYQLFKVLKFDFEKKNYIEDSLKSLKIIKYCSALLFCFVLICDIIILVNKNEDPAGGIAIGALVILLALSLFMISIKLKKYINQE